MWAYGLRNPWRFSFDRATGAMFIGDVGENDVEEIDRGRAGANYGWSCLEGTEPTAHCPPPAHAVPPIAQHTHADGFHAIVGGYVVRDPGLPTLSGRYLYGDLARSQLRSMLPDGTDGRDEPLRVPSLVSFGEDGRGHVYAVSLRATRPFQSESFRASSVSGLEARNPYALQTALRLAPRATGLYRTCVHTSVFLLRKPGRRRAARASPSSPGRACRGAPPPGPLRGRRTRR